MRRFALAGILVATRLFGQTLTPEQSRIVEAVNEDAANSTILLEQLVNINSGTLNPAGVRRVADVKHNRLLLLFRKAAANWGC